MIYDILFPTVVARSSREDLVEPVKNIIQNLDVFEGWRGNANTDLHVLDGYPEIKEQYENEMSIFLHEKMGYGCDLKMTTSWLLKLNLMGLFILDTIIKTVGLVVVFIYKTIVKFSLRTIKNHKYMLYLYKNTI